MRSFLVHASRNLFPTPPTHFAAPKIFAQIESDQPATDEENDMLDEAFDLLPRPPSPDGAAARSLQGWAGGFVLNRQLGMPLIEGYFDCSAFLLNQIQTDNEATYLLCPRLAL